MRATDAGIGPALPLRRTRVAIEATTAAGSRFPLLLARDWESEIALCIDRLVPRHEIQRGGLPSASASGKGAVPGAERESTALAPKRHFRRRRPRVLVCTNGAISSSRSTWRLMANVRGGACRQRGDAIGAERVAAFRREEPPGAGSRGVCLSGEGATSRSRAFPASFVRRVQTGRGRRSQPVPFSRRGGRSGSWQRARDASP
jgi:hypothetical protein